MADDWWKQAVIYQIYPRSFQDTNGDGIGDLRGIEQRLDHLLALGVDALWLSPVYPSPMADFGYDVADYCGIDPIFGALADFDRLQCEAHRRGLKLIMDFVPNHSSDQHPWFLESRASRTSPKRDWYIWRDAAPDGGPPNNWLSHFGGSAWEWSAGTGQYYCHSFLRQQPDLNWRNPAVRRAMYDVLRFWLDRGVDGFRVDVLWLLMKDAAFRDNPPNPNWRAGMPSHDRFIPIHTGDLPEVHDIVAEMRGVLDAYPGRVLIGEIYLPIERLVTYYGTDLGGAHLPFNFQLITAAWHASGIAAIIRDYEAALPPGAWPNWVLGNHDRSRIASRVGTAQARVAAMLLLTLRGTPTLYYGDEIGLTDVPVPPELVQDPAERNEPGIGLGRDPERSPMPWDASPAGGFTSSRPWLPLGAENLHRNVAASSADPQSILALHRQLITLRRTVAALLQGELRNVSATGDILQYERVLGAERIVVVLNMSGSAAEVPVPRGKVLLSTHADRAAVPTETGLALRPDEGVILAAS